MSAESLALKPGARLRSAADETEVIVVRAPSDSIALECGGAPMIPVTDERPTGGSIDPAKAAGTLVGKRYVLDDVGLEVLCTKSGVGSLSIGSVALQQKNAKPLPSSD